MSVSDRMRIIVRDDGNGRATNSTSTGIGPANVRRLVVAVGFGITAWMLLQRWS